MDKIIRSRKGLIIQLTINVICLLLAWLPWIIIKAAKVKPYQRGLFCNDESIKLPYKKSTITTPVYITIGAVIPVLLIILTEAIRYRSKGLKQLLIILQKFSAAFLFGMFVTMSFTQVGKVMVGRLRPNYWSLCKPSNQTIEKYCFTGVTLKKIEYRFVTEREFCTSYEQENERRVSFPSGHTSYSSYCMVFLVIYLEYRTRFGNTYDTLIRAGQIAFMLWPFIVGLSRISDHKHHWSDVLGGAIIGIIWASICSVISSKDCHKFETLVQEEETEEQKSYHIS